MQALTSIICTVFYIGFIRFAPGTWGSIAGVIFAMMVRFDQISMIFLASALFIIGYIFSDIYAQKTGKTDPKEVVIDEVVGMLITLIIAFWFAENVLQIYCKTYIEYFLFDIQLYNDLIALISIILFRLFDIAKPSIIGKIDRTIIGGMGIMLDDVVAGVFAGITFMIISPFILLMLKIWL